MTTPEPVRVVESSALAGLSVRTTAGPVTFVAPGEGPAGVREPRRPKPTRPSAAMEMAVPVDA